MDNREARAMLKNYRYWRDVRIPALQEEIQLGPQISVISNYSGSVRGSNISNPTATVAIKEVELPIQLEQLCRVIRIIEGIRDHLSKDCRVVFDLLIYQDQMSWVEMIDKSQLTEKEFRCRRVKILNYIREAFDGLSFYRSSA